MIAEITITTKSGEKLQEVIKPPPGGEWDFLFGKEFICLEKDIENADLYDTPDILIVQKSEIESIEINYAEEET